MIEANITAAPDQVKVDKGYHVNEHPFSIMKILVMIIAFSSVCFLFYGAAFMVHAQPALQTAKYRDLDECSYQKAIYRQHGYL
jgi:hypothetical protein